MKNAVIADLFDQMADIMEIRGENAFRVNSYRKVARVLRDLSEDVERVAADGRLTEIEGIGESSAQKIGQFLATGHVEAHERLMADFPAGALDLLRIPGLGPKTVAKLMKEKGIDSIDALDQAIEGGALEGMTGMGAKTIENLKSGIAFLRRSSGRVLLGDALPVAQAIVERLRKLDAVQQAEMAGSLRRFRETIGDIDVLATVASDKDAEAAVKAFTTMPNVVEVLAAGPTKGSVRTEEGLQVDLRVVSPESFGAALVYFTGSKAHNIKIRGLALDRKLKINEYGVFKGKRRKAGKSEEEVYAALDLPWIPPELREDRGEVEAAAEGRLPDLVTLQDIRGDLHAHTEYSDGALSVLEMAKAAREMGYSYLAITDHSPSLTVAQGLNRRRLKKQQAEIDAARKELKGFSILKGTEADILADGSIDYPVSVLREMDIVVASVHSRFGMPEKKMTERIIKAARNPYVTAIGHLTGRMLNARDAYSVDVAAVVAACVESGCALELNAHSERLDITDLVCRQAKEAGVKVMIATDAHHARHFWMMQLGVGTARRGWLEKGDVLNCMSVEELTDHVQSRRPRSQPR
jgi:DNA polymerase (family 10)